MTPTKVLLGQILVVLGVAIFGVWTSTEWCAARLGFQPALGVANTFMLGLPIYAPWRLFVWWYFFGAYAPSVFNQAGLLAATSGLLGCASAIIGSVWRARQSRPVNTYGSSCWAKRGEITGAGLFRASGVFLGRLGGRYLRHDGPEHVMAFAPTRSGNRTPVKYTVSAWQELASTLEQYAEAYHAAYGVAEPVAELIPYMLDNFLKSDRWFLTAVRAAAPSSPPPARPGLRETAS